MTETGVYQKKKKSWEKSSDPADFLTQSTNHWVSWVWCQSVSESYRNGQTQAPSNPTSERRGVGVSEAGRLLNKRFWRSALAPDMRKPAESVSRRLDYRSNLLLNSQEIELPQNIMMSRSERMKIEKKTSRENHSDHFRGLLHKCGICVLLYGSASCKERNRVLKSLQKHWIHFYHRSFRSD